MWEESSDSTQEHENNLGAAWLNKAYKGFMPAPDAGSSAQDMCALVGTGTRLTGIFRYTGTVRIDGHIEGEIHTDGILLIGRNAVIRATINARSIESCGKVTGDVIATENIKLLAPAVLKGSVKTPVLSVEEGARFMGNMEMPEVEEFQEFQDVPVRETAAVAIS